MEVGAIDQCRTYCRRRHSKDDESRLLGRRNQLGHSCRSWQERVALYLKRIQVAHKAWP